MAPTNEMSFSAHSPLNRDRGTWMLSMMKLIVNMMTVKKLFLVLMAKCRDHAPDNLCINI